MRNPAKKKWLFLPSLLLFLICIIDCSRHKESHNQAVKTPASTPDTIAIGFYNVENLFDLHYDGTEYPEYRPGALGWNKQTWEKKVGNIASVIAAMNVDAVGLCEVENMNALEGLRTELKKLGADFPYCAIADRPNRTPVCPALLSRLPIVASQGFGGGENAGRRNILEADVDYGGTIVKLFVNHWPSKMHPESQRLAMAQALAGRIARLPAQTSYIVMGDFNADFDEWRKLHTEGLDDTKGLTGLNHIVKTIRLGPGGVVSYVNKREMAGPDRMAHYDLWLDLPEEKRRSRTYHGLPETPDHILLPPSLFDSSGISYIDNSFDVFTLNGTLLRNNEPFGWQMRGFGKRRVHVGEGYSDHLPLCARFTKKPFSFAAPVAADSSPTKNPMSTAVPPGGFEGSMEGWLACGQGIEVCRDSGAPASGRYCLRIQGRAPDKNSCAAHTVLRREIVNRSRWAKIVFDLRGAGNLSVRVRSGKGRWRYYNGQAFASSGSVRYLPVNFSIWRHVALPFTCDDPASTDLTIELRAGKNRPFCFYIDNVSIER
jgi:hypothetical protein